MVGKRYAPYRKGVGIGRGLRRGPERGDHQRRVVFDADLANRRPPLVCQRLRDPDDHVLIFLRMEVHPAKGIGLLGAQRGSRGQQRCDQTGENDPHGIRYIR